MRVLRFGGTVLLLVAATPALAQEEPAGGWSVSARNAPAGGVAVSCSLTMFGTPDGLSITIRNQPVQKGETSTTKHGPAVMRFAIPEKLTAEKQLELTDVSAQIEGQRRWKGLAATWFTRGAGGFVQASLETDVQSTLKPLARGAAFDIGFTVPGGAAKSYSVSLKGSGAAIAAYQNCLAQIR